MRVFIVMLGYNRADCVRAAMENLEATTTDEEHRRLVKTVFLCQYPLPSVSQNREEIIKLAAEFGWWHAEIPNGGVMENHNQAIHDYCHMQPGDFYVVFDPDVRMQQKGWITAMIDALRSEDRAVFCAAAREFHHHDWMQKAPYNRKVHTLPSGVRVSKFDTLVAWSMGMWKGEWLAARPRDFKMAHKFYGYAEHADLALMEKHGKTWNSVTDYLDHHQGSPDELYTQWKLASAQGATSADFNSWLAGRK